MGSIGDELRVTASKVDQIEAESATLKLVVQSQGERIVQLEGELADCLSPDPVPDPDPDPAPIFDILFNASNPYSAVKVSAAPAGTTFMFQGPMTLLKAAIPTRAGNVYFGRDGVKLDGQNTTPLAFTDSKTTGWYVEGFEITGYTGLNGAGEANKEGSAAIILRDDCVISKSHVHHNKYSGVRYDGKNNHIIECELDNNHSEGFCGTSKNGSIKQSNIHHNGDAIGTVGLGNNRGGCKMVHSDGFVYELNWVHHNFWNGLWSDINNIRIKYLWNQIEYNEGSGIFHEVSFECEIAFNGFRDNGINRKISPNDTYPTKAQIEISNSPDVWIHDNAIVLTAGPLGFFGITALNSAHDQWKLGKITNGCLGVRNLRVEKNTITLSGSEWIAVFSMTGNLHPEAERSADQKCGQKPISDPVSNNVWIANTVVKSDGAYPTVPYIFSGAHISEAAWAAKGYN